MKIYEGLNSQKIDVLMLAFFDQRMIVLEYTILVVQFCISVTFYYKITHNTAQSQLNHLVSLAK